MQGMTTTRVRVWRVVELVALALGLATLSAALAWAAPKPGEVQAPLRVGYSDWPGWLPFEVAIQKGWFKEAGIDVQFSWFDYLPSLDAFGAGKIDAVGVTNGDALVMGASGAKSKIILVTDYSNGNDVILARPGIKSFAELKGKKVGVELTLVDHLLFLKALEKFGMKSDDIQLVNYHTNETPQALGSGQVSAIGAWYPSSGQARQAVPGSKVLFSSADVPGLIYDCIAVNPSNLKARKADWVKFTKVWYRVVDFVNDPKTRPEAMTIMAGKIGVKPGELAKAMPGTYILPLAEAKKRFKKGPGLDSLYGSSKVANDFNVQFKVYKAAQVVDEYITPEIMNNF
jgi:NitT/TauT family transport system substrate-binding protein